MARAKRVPREVNPGSLRTVVRRALFGSLELWLYYHHERRAIERRYPLPSGDPEEGEFMVRMREVARDQLREDVRRMHSLGMDGNYLIPA